MKKKYSSQEAREKIQRYCAYQERSHQEVRDKLFSYGIFQNEVDEIMVHLITSGFLNEERFAKIYAGGKFRLKKWGRIKIIHALEGKGLNANCIRAGLAEIDEADYTSALREILEKKRLQLTDGNRYSYRDKLARVAIQKGYEPELVWKMVKILVPD